MVTQIVLALATGVIVGALFSLVQVPIPAPPTLAGVLGIVGIFLGYRGVEWAGARFDLIGMISAMF